MKIMCYIKCHDIDASINFYERIGFFVWSDYFDGDKKRNLEMRISKMAEITIKFRLLEKNIVEKKSEIKSPVMSLLVDNAYDYVKKISNLNITFDRVINSFETVFYCKDPYGNEICITDDDFF